MHVASRFMVLGSSELILYWLPSLKQYFNTNTRFSGCGCEALMSARVCVTEGAGSNRSAMNCGEISALFLSSCLWGDPVAGLPSREQNKTFITFFKNAMRTLCVSQTVLYNPSENTPSELVIEIEIRNSKRIAVCRVSAEAQAQWGYCVSA